jgi:hypothetical protein
VPALPARPADDAVPLTADLRRLHVTVSRRFLAKLEAAREARAHARPHATTEDLLEEALDLLLAKEEKGRAAAAKKPRHADGTAAAVMGAVAIHVTGARPAAGSATWTEQEALATASEASRRLPPQARRDHVPAHVRHSVWARDQGRCTWPLDGGGTCGSTHRLQLDHTFAAARGGPPSLANLRILCEAHNREAARRTFGHRWMERFGNQAGARDAVAAVGSLR